MEFIQNLLGLGVESKHLTFVQISLRGTIVFIVANIMIRVANKRFLSKMTALDVILGFILASMLARAVNGSAPMLPTLGGGFVLVFLHRLLAWLASRSHRFGELVKGHADLLVHDGQVNQDAMRANNLSERDLLEELRQHGNVHSPEDVREAYIERSGNISVVPKRKEQ